MDRKGLKKSKFSNFEWMDNHSDVADYKEGDGGPAEKIEEERGGSRDDPQKSYTVSEYMEKLGHGNYTRWVTFVMSLVSFADNAEIAVTAVIISNIFLYLLYFAFITSLILLFCTCSENFFKDLNLYLFLPFHR